MKKKNGFTLIELLAVIVILAIIALIATPLILKYIEQSRKNTFKDNAYNVIRSGELYYSGLVLKNESLTENKLISFPDKNNTLNIKGEQPKSGKISIKPDGKIAIAVSNGKYCVTKNYIEDEVSIKEEDGDCSLPKIPNSKIVMKPESSISNYDCLTSSSKTCEVGTYLKIQVNDTQSYNFYVIKDDGENLTLLMEKNLVNTVSWYSSKTNKNGMGTIATSLKTNTDTWVNVLPINETIDNFDYTGYNARLLTYNEATSILGCTTSEKSCKGWSFDYTKSCTSYGCNTAGAAYGYWFSTPSGNIHAWGIDYYGYIKALAVDNSSSFGTMSRGMRPVIKVAKFIEQ